MVRSGRARIAWIGSAALALACNTQFDFDVPVPPAIAGNTGIAGGVVTYVTPAGGTGGAAGGAVTSNPEFPNAAECTHHCEEHALVCAVEWLRCSECDADSDCTRSNRTRCDAVMHRCIECGSNLDCAAGYACEPSSRHCVLTCDDGAVGAGGSASDDADCPSGMTCDPSVGHCATCTSDGDCVASGTGSHCHPSLHQCVACLVDGNCASSTPFCDPVEFACVSCRDSKDCDEDHCDKTSHVCVS
jgi:hypothetical protein